MNLSIKDILTFCIDRGLRQFHLNYKWSLTGNAEDIPEAGRKEIQKSKETFFDDYNWFIAFKSLDGNAGAEMDKIANMLNKSLTGGENQEGNDYIRKSTNGVVIAGLKIE